MFDYLTKQDILKEYGHSFSMNQGKEKVFEQFGDPYISSILGSNENEGETVEEIVKKQNAVVKASLLHDRKSFEDKIDAINKASGFTRILYCIKLALLKRAIKHIEKSMADFPISEENIEVVLLKENTYRVPADRFSKGDKVYIVVLEHGKYVIESHHIERVRIMLLGEDSLRLIYFFADKSGSREKHIEYHNQHGCLITNTGQDAIFRDEDLAIEYVKEVLLKKIDILKADLLNIECH